MNIGHLSCSPRKEVPYLAGPWIHETQEPSLLVDKPFPISIHAKDNVKYFARQQRNVACWDMDILPTQSRTTRKNEEKENNAQK